MKKILKIVGLSLLVVLLGLGAYDFYHKHYDYNFGTITENRVYKSGAIDTKDIKDYVTKYGIKTVIDLRNEATVPTQAEEKEAIEKIGGVQYVNIRSSQVPSKKNLHKFFKILDNEENYPIQIHCYHGLGRTMIYVALYRIEYEKWDNDAARHKTRIYPVESFLRDSQFATGRPKGDFLINYVPRRAGDKATINTMK